MESFEEVKKQAIELGVYIDGKIEVRLEDIVFIKKFPRLNKSDYTHEKGVPFYQIGTLGKETSEHISPELYEKLKEKYPLKIGDVVLSVKGSVGKIARVKQEKELYSSAFILFDNDERILLNDFLEIFLESIDFSKLANGGTLKAISTQQILNTKILILSKERQRKVIEIINNIKEIERLNKELEVSSFDRIEYFRTRIFELLEKKNKWIKR